MSDPIPMLEAEAAELVFPSFDENTALTLGQVLLRRASAGKMPIVINIRNAERCFFHAALPGSAPLNDLWARRKSNTTLCFQAASFLVGQRNLVSGGGLDKHGLAQAEYTDSGGSVPIRVRGVGVVAAATVSGLPQAEDHALVVAAIREVLGL